MSLSMRDRVATLVVAAGALVYVLWAGGMLAGISAATAAVVILVLGVVASASAVVPGFAALIAGSRTYLGLASAGGLVALASGILTIVNSTAETLAILVAATVALWAAATVRHASAGSTGIGAA